MALYTFALEDFHIDNTRSRHEDTDQVTFGLRVESREFPIQSLSAGDVNNGDHAVNLSYRSVCISAPMSPVAFSYEIYNGDASKLSVDLQTLDKRLLAQSVDDTVKTSGADTGFANFSSGEAGADVPTLDQDNPFADTSDWSTIFFEKIFVDIGSFLFPDCDGFVAADAIGRTKGQWDVLINSAGGGTFRKSLRYPGSNSPSGCGGNSDYTVTWSVTRARITGLAPYSLRQFLQAQQLALNPGLRSLDPASNSVSVRDLMGLS
ncbi:MAG: hypothetical protein JO076_07380 [Verrucomicrobia bacterium]|nr:hypothetical protein [Verrucomicrobiota bacterium]